MLHEVTRGISRQRGLIKLQSLMRRFLAYRQAKRLSMHYPMVVKVAIQQIEGYVGGFHDISAIISGMVLAVPTTHPGVVSSSVNMSLEEVKSIGKVTSHYRIDGTSGNGGLGGKVALATALNQLDYVVVTLIDRASSEFLGQVRCMRAWLLVGVNFSKSRYCIKGSRSLQ